MTEVISMYGWFRSEKLRGLVLKQPSGGLIYRFMSRVGACRHVFVKRPSNNSCSRAAKTPAPLEPNTVTMKESATNGYPVSFAPVVGARAVYPVCIMT